MLTPTKSLTLSSPRFARPSSRPRPRRTRRRPLAVASLDSSPVFTAPARSTPAEQHSPITASTRSIARAWLVATASAKRLFNVGVVAARRVCGTGLSRPRSSRSRRCARTSHGPTGTSANLTVGDGPDVTRYREPVRWHDDASVKVSTSSIMHYNLGRCEMRPRTTKTDSKEHSIMRITDQSFTSTPHSSRTFLLASVGTTPGAGVLFLGEERRERRQTLRARRADAPPSRRQS
jgi:hypothetical protein